MRHAYTFFIVRVYCPSPPKNYTFLYLVREGGVLLLPYFFSQDEIVLVLHRWRWFPIPPSPPTSRSVRSTAPLHGCPAGQNPPMRLGQDEARPSIPRLPDERSRTTRDSSPTTSCNSAESFQPRGAAVAGDDVEALTRTASQGPVKVRYFSL